MKTDLIISVSKDLFIFGKLNFKEITISLLYHTLTLTNLKIDEDKNQVKYIRRG